MLKVYLRKKPLCNFRKPPLCLVFEGFNIQPIKPSAVNTVLKELAEKNKQNHKTPKVFPMFSRLFF